MFYSVNSYYYHRCNSSVYFNLSIFIMISYSHVVVCCFKPHLIMDHNSNRYFAFALFFLYKNFSENYWKFFSCDINKLLIKFCKICKNIYSSFFIFSTHCALSYISTHLLLYPPLILGWKCLLLLELSQFFLACIWWCSGITLSKYRSMLSLWQLAFLLHWLVEYLGFEFHFPQHSKSTLC